MSEHGKEIVETWKTMPTDPADVAKAMDYYSKHLDELTQKAIAWLAIYTEELTSYKKRLHTRQFGLMQDYKQPATHAEKQALAELVEDKELVDKAHSIHKIFSRIQRRLENRKWD